MNALLEEFHVLNKYSVEDFYVDSIYSRMNREEERLRRFFMDYIIDNKCSFKLNNINNYLGALDIKESNVGEIIKNLRDKNGIYVEDNEVAFVYPVSSKSTNHRVYLEDGRELYAMCAIDSIGCSFTFNKDVYIKSSCSHCGEKITISVKAGEIVDHSPEDIHILHVNTNKFKDWGKSC